MSFVIELHFQFTQKLLFERGLQTSGASSKEPNSKTVHALTVIHVSKFEVATRDSDDI